MSNSANSSLPDEACPTARESGAPGAAFSSAGVFTGEENLYCSILPTATQYARNAIFSGLMPNDIAKMFPDLWVDEDSEEGKNLNEEPLVRTHFERYRRKNTFSPLSSKGKMVRLKMSGLITGRSSGFSIQRM